MRKRLLIAGVAILQLVSLALIGRAQSAPVKPVDLYGIVVGPDGKPVSGANVSLVEVDPQTRAYSINLTTTSDAQGKFKFTSAKPTSLAVARVPGFAISGNVIQNSTADSPTEIKLKAPTELKLKFIGPDGNPVAGLKVWPATMREQTTGVAGITSYVILADKLKDEFTRTTDASGVCTFGEMPQGSMLQFEIGDDHFAIAGNATIINLAAAPTTDGGTIQLELGGSISGKVTAPDGKPVVNLNVMAEGQAQTPSGGRTGWIVSAQTDADGKYVLKKARSGSYTLRFGMTPELSAQYVAPRAEPPFDLTAGQDLGGKDAVLISGGILSGKVTKTGSGDPIAGVRIYAISNDRQNPGVTINTQANAITGADGKYIMHVTPGQQQVTMGNPPPVGYLMPQQRAPAKVITVEDGQTVTTDFELAVDNTPAIKGHVLDEKGAPVAGASIMLQASSNSNTPNARSYGIMSSQAQTDSEGAFSIPGVAESTAIRVRKGNMATLAPMYVTAQNRENLKITIHSNGVSSAKVKLVDPSGAPIADGQLMLLQTFVGTNPMSMQSGTTGADGIGQLNSLYLDTNYAVQARAKGYGSGSINLSLRPNSTVEVSLALVKADSFVAGMVLDENQLPLAGADVYATGPKSDRQTVKTDFTGHFRVENLMPGDAITVYTVMNGRRGQGAAQVERVPAGTDNMILIHNPPAPTTAPAARGRRGP